MTKTASDTVATLLASRRVARGLPPDATSRALTTGFTALDAILAARGFPRGGISELVGTGPRHSLAVATLARSSRQGPVAYLSQNLVLHPDVLLGHGAALENCHLLQETRPQQLFWAAQQILASGLFSLLVLYGSDWLRQQPLIDPLAYRRLRGLAHRHDAVVLLILDAHPALGTFARPCAMRLQVDPAGPDGRTRARRLRVAVSRQAGAPPGASITLEVR